MKQRETWNRIK